jgi:hypothetical protein
MGWLKNLFPKHTFLGKLMGSTNPHGIAFNKILNNPMSAIKEIGDGIKAIKYAKDHQHDGDKKTGGIKPSVNVSKPMHMAKAVTNNNKAGTNSGQSGNNWIIIGLAAAVITKLLKLW